MDQTNGQINMYKDSPDRVLTAQFLSLGLSGMGSHWKYGAGGCD